MSYIIYVISIALKMHAYLLLILRSEYHSAEFDKDFAALCVILWETKVSSANWDDALL